MSSQNTTPPVRLQLIFMLSATECLRFSRPTVTIMQQRNTTAPEPQGERRWPANFAEVGVGQATDWTALNDDYLDQDENSNATVSVRHVPTAIDAGIPAYILPCKFWFFEGCTNINVGISSASK